MDSTDYYERYGNAYFEETVNLSMEDILEEFAEYLPGKCRGFGSWLWFRKGYAVAGRSRIWRYHAGWFHADVQAGRDTHGS